MNENTTQPKRLKIKLTRITPQAAKDMLKDNEGNRPTNRGLVRKYAQDMIDGRWEETSETIKRTRSGRLLDGQHRLQAIIESGRSIQMYIADGLDSSVFDVIDTGKPRKLADCLAINGHKNCAIISAAVKHLNALLTPADQLRTLTNHMGLEFLENHSDILYCVDFSQHCGSRYLIPYSLSAALHYMFRQKSRTEADLFMRQVLAQEGLEKGTPEYQLYRILVKHSHGDVKLKKNAYLQYFVKTWNRTRGASQRIAYIKGQSLPEVR